jgi:hypothetical protein
MKSFVSIDCVPSFDSHTSECEARVYRCGAKLMRTDMVLNLLSLCPSACGGGTNPHFYGRTEGGNSFCC